MALCPCALIVCRVFRGSEIQSKFEAGPRFQSTRKTQTVSKPYMLDSHIKRGMGNKESLVK